MRQLVCKAGQAEATGAVGGQVREENPIGDFDAKLYPTSSPSMEGSRQGARRHNLCLAVSAPSDRDGASKDLKQGEVVMKRQVTTNTGTSKANPTPEPHALSAAPWPKTEKRTDAPAPPPVWTRYIDSRLKQFCVR